MGALLWARACAAEDARALLASLTGSREGFVAFGHDIVREGYVPGFAEFADGRVKSNDPTLLMQFKTVFGL